MDKSDFRKASQLSLCGVALGIWNDLNANEQETVMSMLRGLRKQKNSSSIYIGCFFIFRRSNGNVFLVYSRTASSNVRKKAPEK